MSGRLWLIAAIGAAIAPAQQSIQYASVGGRIIDQRGGAVESAYIVALQTETHIERSTLTDREGRFRFSYLPAGRYTISATKPGFARATREFDVSAGGAYDVQVALSLEAAVANILVSAEAPVVEGSRSQIAGNVTQSEINTVPLNGRNFLDLALLMPGVTPANTASTQLFPETSAVAGQGLSVNSQRNFSNSYIVDGLSANDDAAGLSGIVYAVDAISEFQVVTSGGQAEFGRALAGYVNIVTKSGTNSLHGSLYGYLRNHGMNAKNPLSGEKLPMTQAQYGATLGGPIAKDRAFYFGSFEQRRLNQSGLVTISPANVATVNARLTETGYRGPLLSTGLYGNPVDTTSVLARGDHHAGSRDLLAIRYSGYGVSSKNSRGAGGLNAWSAASGLDNTDHNIAVSHVRAISPTVVNEVRGQFTQSSLAAEPHDPFGPSVAIAGVATFGRMSGSPTGRDNRLYEIVDNFSAQAGAHAIRAGFDFLHNNTDITYPRSIRGSYSFASLEQFLRGTYNNLGFTQTFGNSSVSQDNPNIGLYLQDEWKLHPRLTLNAGIRYDLQFLRTIRTDRNNVSPRLGMSWVPFASGRTVVRGSYGLFYDRIPLRALANALLSSNNTTVLNDQSQVIVSVSPTQSGAPQFPGILLSRPEGTLPNLTTMDRDMQNAYSVQTSVEIERQTGPRSTISAGYQRIRGIHLIASLNQNVPQCIASGINNACRPNAGYANNSQYSAAADSAYNGLHVTFVQRPVKWGNYRISYTYSRSMNNVGEFFFSSPIDHLNIWQDWGRSDEDQRHRLMASGSARGPLGLALSATLQYYSSLPFNITTGATTVQGTTARPVVDGAFIPRNAGKGFDRLQLNLRLARTFRVTERFRLEAIGEMFNATNRVNGVTLNGTFGTGAYPENPSPTFGRTTAVTEPRSGQIALRLSF